MATVTIVSILVALDVFMMALSILITDKTRITISWGDTVYVFILRWILVTIFFTTASGAKNCFTVAGILSFALYGGLATIYSILFISKKVYDFRLLNYNTLEFLSSGCAYVSAVCFTVAAAGYWFATNTFPITLCVVSVVLLVFAWWHAYSPSIRTKSNLMYFNVMFLAKKS